MPVENEISKIDKNFEEVRSENGLVFRDADDSPFAIYGLLRETNGFTRVPAFVADKVSDGVSVLAKNSAGGRVRFATDSDVIAVRCHMPQSWRMAHMTDVGSAGFDLYEYRDGKQYFVGTEIKSIRAGKASLVDSFCYFVGNELFVKGMNVAKYFWGSWGQHEPLRDRKLLLTRKELRHLHQKVKEKGLTIAAVKLYINEEGLAKLRIALARGKKEFDKRQTIKEKDIRREMERGE